MGAWVLEKMGGVVLKGGCMGTSRYESGIKYSQLELLTNPKSN